ncbi:MAG: SAM-dependent chlorinase/fluorinase [Candidatus Brockarchaeota archaeon]|nr:SAM-dependent chlorinase/fluorinase [Candidatus Brockarchaeota archaeon]MBO3768687.1 SAM-dependent chlorinase/fluorinase [Candidatus Brockarchaeota archaeon]
MKRSIIAILTDFGEGSIYVAQMKGVILSINKEVTIIEITNSVERHNIRQASFLLSKTVEYFPPGTIFIAVVDPGVGSSRKNIVLKVDNKIFIGPDNGIFTGVISGKIFDCWEIENEKYISKNVSKTFHGRDVYSYVAAYISKSVKLGELGKKINSITLLEPEEISIGESFIKASVLFIDSFGNIVLNANEEHLKKIGVNLGDYVIVSSSKEEVHPAKFVFTYSDVDVGQLALLANSIGVLELSINQGNASEKLGMKTGSEVTITKI